MIIKYYKKSEIEFDIFNHEFDFRSNQRIVKSRFKSRRELKYILTYTLLEIHDVLL